MEQNTDQPGDELTPPVVPPTTASPQESAVSAIPPATSLTTSKSLPSINTLFSESWHLLTKHLLSLFIFTLIYYAAIAGLLFAGFIGVGAFGVVGAFQQDSPATLSAILTAGVFSLLFMIGLIIAAIVMQIGSYLIVGAKEGEKIEYGAIIKRSFGFIMPFFVVSFLSSLVIGGGLMVFLIPGLLFSIFFMFAPYEVLFDNKRGLNALRSSYSMVTENFGAIVGRWALLIVLFIFVSGVTSNFIPSTKESQDAQILMGVGLSYIINTALGWYTLAYFYTLYKHAKQASASTGTKSMLWIGVVSTLGWVLLIALFGLILALVGSLLTSDEFRKQIEKQYDPTIQQQPNGKLDIKEFFEELTPAPKREI